MGPADHYQNLHHRAVLCENLSDDEQRQLDQWYANMSFIEAVQFASGPNGHKGIKVSNTRSGLMRELSYVREKLGMFGVRDSSDYAELLVAEAVDGERVKSRVNKGHDVVAPEYGRIEVKCRLLPLDGRLEERVDVSETKELGFDYLGLVIFNPDYMVKGAVLAPYLAVWEQVRDQPYRRINYTQAVSFDGAIDITGSVRLASSR